MRVKYLIYRRNFAIIWRKKKYEKKIGARITCVTAVPARSWTASSESASSLIGKVAEEEGELKENRRAIHPFEHLFGMPLAPSSTLPYFFLPLFLPLVRSRIQPSGLFLPRLTPPRLPLRLVFLDEFAKCGVPSS